MGIGNQALLSPSSILHVCYTELESYYHQLVSTGEIKENGQSRTKMMAISLNYSEWGIPGHRHQSANEGKPFPT